MKDRSPWLELHLSAATHRKTDALGVALGVDRVTALGHICSLWLWSLEQAQDGDLAVFSDQAVADAGGWRRKPAERFRAALITSGYLDADSRLHEWGEYVGKLMERRRKDRNRKRGASTGTAVEYPQDIRRNRGGSAVEARTSQSTVDSRQSTVDSQLSPPSTTTSPSTSRGRAREEGPVVVVVVPEANLDELIERPNIYRLYESLGWTISPAVTGILADMESEYEPAWLESAFAAAAEARARNVKYVEAVLRHWRDHGRDCECGKREAKRDDRNGQRRDDTGEHAAAALRALESKFDFGEPLGGYLDVGALAPDEP